MTTSRIAVTGNTYPVKDQIKALGGRWDADRKVWTVPADQVDRALALIAGTPAKAHRGRRDHEDCLSLGPCGPHCEYAGFFGR